MNDSTFNTTSGPPPNVTPQPAPWIAEFRELIQLRAEVDRWRAEAEWVREQWHRDTAILRERVAVLEAEHAEREK